MHMTRWTRFKQVSTVASDLSVAKGPDDWGVTQASIAIEFFRKMFWEAVCVLGGRHWQ